jgi:hypothetical protein
MLNGLKICIDFVMILFSISYIIDHSGIVQDISKKIFEIINKNEKWNGKIIKTPLTCTKCLSFWVVLFYSLFILNYTFIVSLFIASECSLLSKLISILISFTKLKIIGLNKYIQI